MSNQVSENFESKDEAFAEVGIQADELDKLVDDLRRRLLSDDVLRALQTPEK